MGQPCGPALIAEATVSCSIYSNLLGCITYCGCLKIILRKSSGTDQMSGRIRSQRLLRQHARFLAAKANLSQHNAERHAFRREHPLWSVPPSNRRSGSRFDALHKRASIWREIAPARHFCSRPAFVSKHFRLGSGDVERYLRRHNVVFRINGEHVIVEVCPFCHPTNEKSDNHYKLFVWRDAGTYCCHRCNAKGSWFDLRRRLSPIDDSFETATGSIVKAEDHKSSAGEHPFVEKALPKAEGQESYVRNLFDPDYRFALNYLIAERRFSEEVLKKYGVGVGKFHITVDGKPSRNEMCITFPMYDGDGRLVRHKIRSVKSKSGMRLAPKGGNWGFFGLDLVPSDADSVVLTEGEFDAMSVYQASGRPAISLPNGASSLPLDLLPFLERFKRIFLWMDEDAAGKRGTELFSNKLGKKRCLNVQGHTKDGGYVKDANEALQKGMDLDEFLDNSAVVPHGAMLRFEDIREQIFADMVNQDTESVKAMSLPRLNALTKGLRPGEMTIVSGHTGIGKTTLLSQLSLDYSMQGVRTLWGSLEIPYVRLAARMLKQFHAVCSEGQGDLVNEFDLWADRFSELPIYFLKYHGSCPIEQIMDAMEYANYVHDCSHVVLDNLQFMSYGQRVGSNSDRIEIMNHAVAQIRDYCTSKRTHVTLVVHPRKVDDGEKIQLASVFGSAKATQDADNVLVLQRGSECRELEVLKNRFDGTLGSVKMRFDQQRLLFSQIDSPAVWTGWNYKQVVDEITAFSEGTLPKTIHRRRKSNLNSSMHNTASHERLSSIPSADKRAEEWETGEFRERNETSKNGDFDNLVGEATGTSEDAEKRKNVGWDGMG